MPSGTDNDSHFRFLISCIRHSTAGKVDFEEVRKECDIVSKGAAAKRYERLMKAHGISTSTGVGSVKKEVNDSNEAKKTKARVTKKRKLEEVNEDEGDIDEPVKQEAKVKGEIKYEDAIVKPEYRNDDLSSATPLHYPSSQSQPASSSTTQSDDEDDEVLFISAIEKSPPDERAFGDCPQSELHAPVPVATSVPSIDYAANMNFPQQLAAQHPVAMTPTMTSSYAVTPTTWVYPHDSHGYF
ncbi:hypothetical protein F5Y14DRAFT_438904 [Nemania sp. NC0429]|nr:hypothetical protein F5Y14DRAFT_438904 [Nemania sp. NC0429]